MQPLVVGLNIKSASVDMLEALSIHHSVNALYLKQLMLHARVQGIVILSTCNRLEFYAVASNPKRSSRDLLRFLALQSGGYVDKNMQSVQDHIYEKSGKSAVRHLYRVVSGLDSMVLGETEILGQVARAYEVARCAKTTDKVLNVWFQRALCVGKKVRTTVGMDKYHTSVGRLAVDLAEQELKSLDGKQILVLGAGEMSELAIKHLVAKTRSLVMVSNRSLPKARALAAEYGFEAYPLSELAPCLQRADLVLSATASQHLLISYDLLKESMSARSKRTLICIDMAVPRDIDPRASELSGVQYFDIKQLQDLSSQNYEQRKHAALFVEAVIDEKVEEFQRWASSAQTPCTVNVLQKQIQQAKETMCNKVHSTSQNMGGEAAS